LKIEDCLLTDYAVSPSAWYWHRYRLLRRSPARSGTPL